jgi:hypothetical protein
MAFYRHSNTHSRLMSVILHSGQPEAMPLGRPLRLQALDPKATFFAFSARFVVVNSLYCASQELFDLFQTLNWKCLNLSLLMDNI